jgi:hypothetical protein
MFEIQAIVRSPSAIAGTYRLVTVKHNDAGTSQTVQQGRFDLPNGGERQLSTTLLEAASKGHVTASLMLGTDQGEVLCSFPK